MRHACINNMRREHIGEIARGFFWAQVYRLCYRGRKEGTKERRGFGYERVLGANVFTRSRGGKGRKRKGRGGESGE